MSNESIASIKKSTKVPRPTVLGLWKGWFEGAGDGPFGQSAEQRHRQEKEAKERSSEERRDDSIEGERKYSRGKFVGGGVGARVSGWPELVGDVGQAACAVGAGLEVTESGSDNTVTGVGGDSTKVTDARLPSLATAGNVMVYAEGERCANHVQRRVLVTIVCGTETKLVQMEEEEVCVYTAFLTTPLACTHHDRAAVEAGVDEAVKAAGLDDASVRANPGASAGEQPGAKASIGKQGAAAEGAAVEVGVNGGQTPV
jgi:hypothetical protein